MSRAWNRFQDSVSATQCHAGGRQRATTTIQDRFLEVQARRHAFVNTTTLRSELRIDVGVNISTQTVHNRLRQSGLRSRREFFRIPLPRLHKQARLNWTEYHVNWTDNDWDNRRQSSAWTGRHDHLISTRWSMFGTCCRWRFCDVQTNQRLSCNWEMPSLKIGTILRWQPPRDSLEA